ncbi:cytochrome P450 [Amycolatopsis sp. 195334CR]|uniref:cytochrome P450 n=1 Tax=Amycolatopsis sp. 195334CR TaxID=2814588 RepID=UPI001A8D36EF|nr:cytochrome P450 [Amycolatopsis sp. 195334CR]MBN6042279.1 cytochrome P450 [Amycolatopsis sp. 195334CR]
MLSLPELVVALRVRVFEAVNGDQVITLPDQDSRFMEVYAHPAANGRSRGAELSDLFWYWLSPGPEVHQEHLEDGPRYDEVARTTLRILAGSSEKHAEAAARCTAAVLDALVPGRARLVRLRDLMMPVWAEFCYELVFREPCPPEARKLIVGHADDVVTALKCTGLRHPRRRARLTRYLARRLPDIPHVLPDSLSDQEKVHYLQGTFFNTAVVQLSEAMAHLLLVLAQHPDVQRRLAEDPGDERYFAQVLDETLRLFPLFGIAHRIATADIETPGGTLPEGSVLCFSYPGYHATGYTDPEVFDPSRWERLSARDAHHIPFGVAANRPCPAWRLSPLVMRAATIEVLRRFRLHSTVSHTRPLPHRAPCLLDRRAFPLPASRVRAIGAFLRVRDRVENLTRSVAQLVFGTWMVLDARHRRLAGRYFDTHDTQGCPIGPRNH